MGEVVEFIVHAMEHIVNRDEGHAPCDDTTRVGLTNILIPFLGRSWKIDAGVCNILWLYGVILSHLLHTKLLIVPMAMTIVTYGTKPQLSHKQCTLRGGGLSGIMQMRI